MLGLGAKIIAAAALAGAAAAAVVYFFASRPSEAARAHHKEVMEEFREVKSRLSWIMGTVAANSQKLDSNGHKLDILCSIATNAVLDVEQSK